MGGNTRRHIKKTLHCVRNLRTWQYILILIPLLFLTATFLRIDHIRMTELKSAVLNADSEGDTEKISSSLEELKKFTFSHMVINIDDSNGNYDIYFGTGPFYLEQQYLRDANATIEKAEREGSTNPNGNIYAAATAICKPQAIANGWSWNSTGYLECMTSEIAKYPASDNFSSAEIPSTELYRYNFASPIWTPSLSGFSIILCIILFIVIFARLLIWLILRIALIFLKKA